MSCKVKIINSCEIYGNKFVDRVLNFTDRDLTNDSFSAKVISMNGTVAEIQGIKVANKVLFPVDSIQNLRIGNYKIEYWAVLDGLGKNLFVIENFKITNQPCDCESFENGNVTFEVKDVVIDVEIFKSVVNLGNMTDEDREKLESLENYDDTEIKEEIAEKVDKVEGFGLSENNFSDADLEKLEGLENFDPTDINNALGNKVDKIEGKGLSDNNYTSADKTKLDNINLSNYVLQSSLNTQLTSYVLQSTLNNQLASYATLSGVQTFSSTITFTQAPIVPNPTLPAHAVNLNYLTANYVSYGSNRVVNVGRVNYDATVREVASIARFFDIISLANANLFTYQREYWNGNSFVVMSSPTINIGENSGAGGRTVSTNNIGGGAGRSASGNHNNHFGNSAGANSYGDYNFFSGLNAGVNNNKSHNIGVGLDASSRNNGSSTVALGLNSNSFNVADSVIAIGQDSLSHNIGNANVGVGYRTNRYAQGNNNNVFGHNSNATFKPNVGGNKAFDSTAIDVNAKTITIPNHGFGSTNAYRNLLFTQGSSAITGIANTNIIQVKIIDANTVLYSELLASGQYRHTHNITNAGTGTGHIFTPQFEFFNVHILGSNLEPTKANQTLLGGAECLLPQSTVQTLRNDATGKTAITKEFFHAEPKTFIPATASTVANNTIFVDSADGKLKFKDGSGVLNNLY